jgi:hypothetical protein
MVVLGVLALAKTPLPEITVQVPVPAVGVFAVMLAVVVVFSPHKV